VSENLFVKRTSLVVLLLFVADFLHVSLFRTLNLNGRVAIDPLRLRLCTIELNVVPSSCSVVRAVAEYISCVFAPLTLVIRMCLSYAHICWIPLFNAILCNIFCGNVC